MRAAVIIALALNSGLFACADDGSEGANTGGGGDGTYDPSKSASNEADQNAGLPQHDPDVALRAAVDEAISRHFKEFGDEFSARYKDHQEALDERLARIEATLAKLEDVPHNDSDAGHPRYEELRNLVMETRGHVDNLSRDVSTLRRG